MSNQRTFYDILDQFNSDEEEENEEDDISKRSEEIKQHKKSSSLIDDSKNKIQDKLFNTNREIVKKNQFKNRKRDEFGYFINNDEVNSEENNENEERTDSNENKEEESDKEENNDNDNNDDNLDNNSQQKENENSLNNSQNEEELEEKDENVKDNTEIENEKEIDNDKENNVEENQENEIEQNEINEKENDVEENKENDEEQNDKNDNENNIEENKEDNIKQKENENSIGDNQENDLEKNEQNNNEENINNNEILDENNNEKKEEQNMYSEQDEKEEENNLINELYDKNKVENIEQTDFENFRMGSFRPKPIPGSPKFSKRISKNNEPKIESKENNNKDEDKKEKNSNYNLNNFTETIETTIEGDKIQTKESNNKNIPIFTHDNSIISLGKIPIKESFNNNNINELLNKKNNDSLDENSHKNSVNEEKAEEEFLKREEIKRQKNKEEQKNNRMGITLNKQVKNTHNKKEEDDGKENVTEDEEEKKVINNKEGNIKKEIENLPNEIKEDSKEYMFSSINTLNNESIYLDQKSIHNNEMNDIKMISTKLLTDYQNAGNSQNNSVGHSYNNSGSKNNSNKNKNIVIQENKILEPVIQGVNRNIFSKKLPSDRYLNKNSKKANNPMPVMNNVIYGSPSDKRFKNNNVNYSIDQSKNISTNNKDISPFNYNNISNQSKQIDSTKKKHELKKMKNKLYNDSNEKNFKKINIQENLTFKPKINPKSREISEQKMIEIKNNYNINENNNQTGTPLGLLLLYEDANIKQEKLNQENIKQNNDIISKANSKKINDISYNMVNDRLNRKINNAISKFGKKEENKIILNIVNMTQCLYELNIINELIKPKDNIQEINTNNQIDLAELQAMVEAVNDKDIKKSEEVELIEQLWYLLNPELKQNIDSEILCIFLKLFFCENYSQKDLEKLIISLLDKYKINHSEKKEEEYQSPLRSKKYKQNQIWSLAKFIKVFLNLKKNLKAYRENDYTKGDVYNNIIKEKDKELTFEPNFVSNKYFYKYSQFQYNKDNSIIGLINKYKNQNQKDQKQKHDFNKVYERFKAQKEFHEKAVQKIREMQEEKELKMCTNVPKINKYIPKSRNDKDFPSSEKKKMLTAEERIYNINKTNKKQPRYKLLYNLHQKYNKRNKVENRIDKSDIVDENCTFTPKIGDTDFMNRTFSNIKHKKKPKGFNDYVNRNRSLLEKKEHEKKLEEDKRYGRNYDKMHKSKSKNKIKPLKLNIPSLSKSASKNKNNKQYIINTDTSHKNRYNIDIDKTDNIIKDVYITLDIKTPSGIIKQLKIYNKNDKSTIDDINSFCKIYSLNEDAKKMMIQKAIQYKNNFFGKSKENNNRNHFLNQEDYDNIINKFRNDGNV